MKTAMQELIEIYEYYHSFEEFNEWFMDMGKKAMLEKEKEQIIKTYLKGDSNGCGCYDFATEKEAGEYYNQTYTQDTPAVDLTTNPKGTDVWKELYDRYRLEEKEREKGKDYLYL